MKKQEIDIGTIPAVIWGEDSDKAYLFVHGKMASKEAAGTFARIADSRGYQTLSFDLPGHGARQAEAERCDVWNGTRDVLAAADCVFSGWKEISLFACSIGAWFSLQALSDRPFRRCLFQSPIVDMEYLIRQMMLWFGISEERLEREREIETPVDLMTWDYYRYVMEHPTARWTPPTHILYGRKDSLQSFEVINRFSETNGAELTVAEGSEHAFMADGDEKVVSDWISRSI